MRYLFVLLVLLAAPVLEAANNADQLAVQQASSPIAHYLRQLRPAKGGGGGGHGGGHGGSSGGGGGKPSSGGGSKPAPAPAPAPKPAPAPAPKPAPAPVSPSSGNGARSPPSPPVPRPAGVPSPIPYRPVTPVAYVQPTVVRPVIVQPVGYIYHPVYYHPVYIARPVVVIRPVYWTTNACYQDYCYYDYNRCVNFYGDGCYCYPGLLRCLRSSCYSFYQPAYEQCSQDLLKPSRCVLSCQAAPYPLPQVAATSNGTATNGTNETIVAPAPPTQYSVVVVVLIQGLNASTLDDAQYDFAGAVATSLEPVNASIVRDNVTLSYRGVIINSTDFLEVTVGVAMPSLEKMNTTDARFQDMMYGNVTNNTLSAHLVKNNVLFNETQLSFDTIKSNVFVASEDGTVAPSSPTSSGGVVASTGLAAVILAVTALALIAW
ncbi:hypothetical protein AC1031_009874 [Aphanomyces cochlioides]|nr:hypothetical protein AC1031_009874 [Aphanomyces cochlioides]